MVFPISRPQNWAGLHAGVALGAGWFQGVEAPVGQRPKPAPALVNQRLKLTAGCSPSKNSGTFVVPPPTGIIDMKRMCFGALAFTLAAAFATMASAQKVTLEQARAECRQQHQKCWQFSRARAGWRQRISEGFRLRETENGQTVAPRRAHATRYAASRLNGLGTALDYKCSNPCTRKITPDNTLRARMAPIFERRAL